MSIRPYQFNFGTLGNEIDALFAEMEARASSLMSQAAANTSTLPDKVRCSSLPGFGNDFHIDVCENENDIIVVTDLPGMEKEDISVKLLNPETLLIKTEQHAADETTDDAGTYHIRERRFGSMQRSIRLPSAVETEGATASFKNGVMEIVLPKVQKKEVGVDIRIE